MNADTIVQKINDAILDISEYMNEEDVDNDSKKKNKSQLEMAKPEIDRIYENFKLKDRIVAFYDGREWNVIRLDFMHAHPIIYYKHWSDKESVYFDNSLVVCPLTMRSMIYKGKIKIARRKNYELWLENTSTGDVFPMSNPYTGRTDQEGQEKKIKSHVKRHEVKIMEHRDIFAFDSDPRYVSLDLYSGDKKMNGIMDSLYYSDRHDIDRKTANSVLHPKTLIYVVQYYSKTDDTYRHMILCGPEMNRDSVTGYEYRSTRIWKYMEDNKTKLIEKRAFVYPMLWYAIEMTLMANYDAIVLE